MRIMQFCIFFSMGSHCSVLGSFWVSFWVSRETFLEPGGTHLDFSWATWRLLGCLGWPLGSLVGPIWASVGWLCALLKPCDANLGISWVTLSPLGSDLASFGYLVCESSFFALSLDATCWVCGYWCSRFRSMSMCKYWSRATQCHKTKCTPVRNLPVHVYMLIHYMTCALAATNYWKLLDSNLTMAGSTRYDCNTYIRLHWSFWLMVYTCKDP